MDFAEQIQPSLWTSLLWKDFRQVRATLLAVTSGVFVMQLISLAVAVSTSDARLSEGMLGTSSILACLAPIFFAIGCSGMLIGHERQTGTWAWSSALPVSWRQALGSKLIVSLIGSILVGTILAIIPILLVTTGRLTVNNTSWVTVYVSGLTAIALLEVIACFNFASLMLRETLTALVVAGLALCLGHLILSLGIVISLEDLVYRETRASEIYGYVASLLIVLLGGMAMALAFRWRWGTGQQTELTIIWPKNSPAVLPTTDAYQYTSDIGPNEWWMHVRLSFVNSWPMRLSVLVAGLTLAMLIVDGTSLIVVATLAVGLFGLSAFEGDQTLDRFRFLADRGVSPWKLVACRLSVAAVWALPIVCIILTKVFVQLQQPQRELPELLTAWVLAMLAFLLSALASLCFRKAVIAATVATVVGITWLSISIATIDFVVNTLRSTGMANFDFWALSQIACLWSPLAMFVLLIAIFRLARRWIVWAEPRLPLQFAWVTTIAFLAPAFFAINSIFLLIPQVPWQGLPLSELSQTSVVVPDLQSLKQPLLPAPITKLNNGLLQLYRTSPLQNILADSQAQTLINESLDQAMVELESESMHADPSTASEVNAEFVKLVQPFVSEFEAMLQGSTVLKDSAETSVSINKWIGRSAILASLVSRSGEAELALRLWHVNRVLQELGQSCDAIATANARNFAMLMLQGASESEIKAMGDSKVFSSLIPKAADESSAIIRESREWATFGREYLRGNVEPQGKFSFAADPPISISFVRNYFPVRWYLERKLALDMKIASDYYASQRKDCLTGVIRDRLLENVR